MPDADTSTHLELLHPTSTRIFARFFTLDNSNGRNACAFLNFSSFMRILDITWFWSEPKSAHSELGCNNTLINRLSNSCFSEVFVHDDVNALAAKWLSARVQDSKFIACKATLACPSCFTYTKYIQSVVSHLDPSAAPPTRFRLAAVKSGWRAGLSRRAVENSAGGGAKIFRLRRDSSRRQSVNTQIGLSVVVGLLLILMLDSTTTNEKCSHCYSTFGRLFSSTARVYLTLCCVNFILQILVHV